MPVSKKSIKSKTSVISAVAIVAVILIVGGVYSVMNKKDNSDASSGYNSNNKIETVQAVEQVVARWVEKNPEAIVQSIIAMQQKSVQQQQQATQSNIGSKLDDIYNHQGTPVHEPKGYDVSVVEFFDYNCGYCKRAQNTVAALLKADKKVRFIFKEYPILGTSSEALSSVALAVNMADSNKYLQFHNALMQSSARSKEDALKVAKDVVGVDIKKVKRILAENKDEIAAQIDFNRKLGSSIGVNGTPAFIVGKELISGAVSIDVLKAKIKQQRQDGRKF